MTCSYIGIIFYSVYYYKNDLKIIIFTVNLDFIRQGAGFASHFMPDKIVTITALYAPLDGMNEKRLCVSVKEQSVFGIVMIFQGFIISS